MSLTQDGTLRRPLRAQGQGPESIESARGKPKERDKSRKSRVEREVERERAYLIVRSHVDVTRECIWARYDLDKVDWDTQEWLRGRRERGQCFSLYRARMQHPLLLQRHKARSGSGELHWIDSKGIFSFDERYPSKTARCSRGRVQFLTIGILGSDSNRSNRNHVRASAKIVQTHSRGLPGRVV